MGTGVGGGIVINKQIHAGAMGIAGEWGHNPLLEHGPACYCGRQGLCRNPDFRPWHSVLIMKDREVLPGSSPAEIINYAESGDKLAINCY